ncbi:MAG: PaaI family thioesterase [Proteobacteria bacterium]|nr:MAG: PaaI family thioesterase [Pseudomonadota bacterium]
MSAHDLVLKSMNEMAAKFSQAGHSLQMPPHSNSALGTQYIDLTMGTMLEARIPYDLRYTNPLLGYQGGFLCAALDDVYGPLTYMSAERPVVTIEMSTSFIRPFHAKDEFVTIKAEVVTKTKALIFLKAEVRSREGKLIATSTNHSMIIQEQNAGLSR